MFVNLSRVVAYAVMSGDECVTHWVANGAKYAASSFQPGVTPSLGRNKKADF